MTERINFRPIKNRILAKQIFEKREANQGLIVSLDDLKEELPTNRLEIIRVGKDCEEVVEGDTVVFDNRGTRIEHQGEKYLIIEEKNVLGIIEK